MKASLRKDRWQTLNLGEPKQYTSKAVQERWQKQRDQWLKVNELLIGRTLFRQKILALIKGATSLLAYFPKIHTIRSEDR